MAVENPALFPDVLSSVPYAYWFRAVENTLVMTGSLIVKFCLLGLHLEVGFLIGRCLDWWDRLLLGSGDLGFCPYNSSYGEGRWSSKGVILYIHRPVLGLCLFLAAFFGIS